MKQKYIIQNILILNIVLSTLTYTMEFSPVYKFEHNAQVNAVAFNSDDSTVVTVSCDKTGKLWDTETGNFTGIVTHDAAINSVVFNHDDSQLVTTSHDRSAKTFDTHTTNLLHKLHHESNVTSAVLNPYAHYIATVSHDKTAKIWNAKCGTLLQTLEHKNIVNAAIFVHHSLRLATASNDMSAKLFYTETGKLLQDFPHNDAVYSVRFLKQKYQLITATKNQKHIWDLETGKHLRSIICDYWKKVVLSPDELQLVTKDDENKNIVLYDTTSFNILGRLAYKGPIHSMECPSNDNTEILTTENCTAKIWNIKRWKLLQTLSHDDDPVQSAVFSHDGSKIATIVGNMVILWKQYYSSKCLVI